nr:immunoglobulin heavy chain junction region [Mus musculus]
CARSDYAFAYW